MTPMESILKRVQSLNGIKDPRGPVGILSRGANVYNQGTLAAHSGPGYPGQYGRPPQNAVQRRLFNR
jgi:hypothetical protein